MVKYDTNFEDILTVDLPGTMDFDHITLNPFRTSQLLPVDALPAHYPRGPATAWRVFWLSSFLQPAARLTYEPLALGSSTTIQVRSGLHVDGQTTIACTVWAIWRCHWRFVFDDRTFWSDEAAA
ncbi:hypothetical protein G6F70_000076 [Rhizopus microsporus]|nr:hypothetical protein G6F71_003627 [Rhizopus microsporus]KAG1204939.1 hypothetical protein G6F70_000076 [Rhizopus microsporus]KAG1216451.1 hypothetical protein G6F69_000022 [Rhizopus microsporus]KAG1235515.1 hypothetical protein G6F67_002719 [Rhizopus microsporus]KAG1259914.1 hypothetical protein G6F68_007795 [Rhizopus microsporus]